MTTDPGSCYVQLSVDDVLTTLASLRDVPGDDPWVQPELGFLRALHRRTGIVVGLYLFERHDGNGLEDVPDRFRQAFAEASSWLRFGFHAHDPLVDYGPDGVEASVARRDYERTVTAIERFAGRASLDRMPRLHRFVARGEIVRALRDAAGGIVGLLAPDDDRAEAYDLGEHERDALRRDGRWLDAAHGVAYVGSLPRLERDPDPAATLARWRHERHGAGPHVACLFTHEPDLRVPLVRARIVRAVSWAVATGVRPGWPAELFAS